MIYVRKVIVQQNDVAFCTALHMPISHMLLLIVKFFQCEVLVHYLLPESLMSGLRAGQKAGRGGRGRGGRPPAGTTSRRRGRGTAGSPSLPRTEIIQWVQSVSGR